MDTTNEVASAQEVPNVESDKLLILIADDSRLLRKKLHEELNLKEKGRQTVDGGGRLGRAERALEARRRSGEIRSRILR